MIPGNKQKVSSHLRSTSYFKQQPGETLKDAWVRINRIHYEDPTPCEDEKLNLHFYYGIDPWYQNALDGATGGSFVLSTPSCAAMTLRRIFGSFVGSKKKIEDTTVALALSKDKLEARIEKLPDKEDFEQLAFYYENIIPKMDNELANVMHKLRLCEREFLEKNAYLNRIEEKLVCVNDSLRKNPSFKHEKEDPVKKQVWIKKERKVEEVKMLNEVKEPLLDLDNCTLQELIAILQKFAVIAMAARVF